MFAVGVKGTAGAEQILGIVQLGTAAVGKLDLAVFQPLRIEHQGQRRSFDKDAVAFAVPCVFDRRKVAVPDRLRRLVGEAAALDTKQAVSQNRHARVAAAQNVFAHGLRSCSNAKMRPQRGSLLFGHGVSPLNVQFSAGVPFSVSVEPSNLTSTLV